MKKRTQYNTCGSCGGWLTKKYICKDCGKNAIRETRKIMAENIKKRNEQIAQNCKNGDHESDGGRAVAHSMIVCCRHCEAVLSSEFIDDDMEDWYETY